MRNIFNHRSSNELQNNSKIKNESGRWVRVILLKNQQQSCNHFNIYSWKQVHKMQSIKLFTASYVPTTTTTTKKTTTTAKNIAPSNAYKLHSIKEATV
jgi:hypothetical protein